jgi:hypothetical protein
MNQKDLTAVTQYKSLLTEVPEFNHKSRNTGFLMLTYNRFLFTLVSIEYFFFAFNIKLKIKY